MNQAISSTTSSSGGWATASSACWAGAAVCAGAQAAKIAPAVIVLVRERNSRRLNFFFEALDNKSLILSLLFVPWMDYAVFESVNLTHISMVITRCQTSRLASC